MDIRRQLATLDEQGVPVEGKSASELQKLKKALADAQRVKEERIREKAQGNLDLGKNLGVTEYLGTILQDLVKIDRDIGQKEVEINEIEAKKLAAGIVEDIFESLASDSNVMFSELGHDLLESFGSLVPGTHLVSVEGLALEDIQVTDKGNELRSIVHLSRGTRDTFIFAARLTLALKADSGKENRLLVLDEPFYTMDLERARNALKMVRKVQDEYRFQVVLLTKDANLVKIAEEELKTPLTHAL